MAFQLAEDCDPGVREIYAYWCSIRPPDTRLPGRQHMDPLDIPRLLAQVWLADIERNPFRARFRLVGSAFVKTMGLDLTGAYLDECFDNFTGSEPHDALVEVCSSGIPAWRRGAALLTRPGYNAKQIERISLPLAADGETVDLILGLSVHVLQE